MTDKLRILICGAGNRTFPKDQKTSLFRGWFETLRHSPDFEVSGVVDVAEASLQRVRGAYALDGIPTFTDLDEAIAGTNSNAILVAPIAEAHAESAGKAIEAGLAVLIEKPLVTKLSDAAQLIRRAKDKNVPIGVVQNWRGKSMGLALKKAVVEGTLGTVGNIFFRYVRDREAAHLPAYLFEEPYPLLYAMGIHHIDLFRFILGEKIVTVEGKGFTPPWSRYKSAAGVHLFMTTESGVTISYAGTFSSKNKHVPQESLIVEGSKGSATNDSQWGDPPLLFSGPDQKEPIDLTAGEPHGVVDQYNKADDVYAADFAGAVRTGVTPLCSAEDNVWTLAAIEAAVEACTTGKTVDVRELVEKHLG